MNNDHENDPKEHEPHIEVLQTPTPSEPLPLSDAVSEPQADPALSPTAMQVVTAETAVEKPLEGITVYIVDDDTPVARVAARSIKTAGGVGIITESGHECLNLLRSAGKNIAILTDYLMPKMTGLEFAKAVRELPNGKNIPIVMISGGGFDDLELEAALAFKIIDVFQHKPISPEQIRTLIKEACDKKKAEQSA
ncbi:response regulator [Patescibacteria group bacterium]